MISDWRAALFFGEVCLGTDDSHHANAGEIHALPFAGGDVPGHHRVAAGGDDFTVVMTSTRKDAGRTHFNIITLQANVLRLRTENQCTNATIIANATNKPFRTFLPPKKTGTDYTPLTAEL